MVDFNFSYANATFEDEKTQQRHISDELATIEHKIRELEIVAEIPDSTRAHKTIISSKSSVENCINVGTGYKYIDFVQWEGRVIQLEQNGFIAQVIPISRKSAPMIVRFNSKKIQIVNSHKMSEGATFIWTVGHAADSDGAPIKKRSIVQFRLIPNVDLTFFEKRLAEETISIIEGIKWLE